LTTKILIFIASHAPYVYLVHTLRRVKRMATAIYSPLLKTMPLTCRAWVVDYRSQRTFGFPQRKPLPRPNTNSTVSDYTYETGATGTSKTCVEIQSRITLRYLTVKDVRMQLRCLNPGNKYT